MIDQQSLIDLNILPGPESRVCLQTKLDYCQTKGGKAHLQSLLKLENLDYIVIRERQACIQYITTHFTNWRLPISEDNVFYLQHYLGAAYTGLRAEGVFRNTLMAYKELWFNKAHYYFVLSGVKMALQVVQDITLLCRTVYNAAMPACLKTKLQAAQEIVASLGVGEATCQRFLQGSFNVQELFNIDHLLRARHSAAIQQLLNIYYELEVYYSLACAHRDMELRFPTLQQNGTDIHLQELRHPLVNHCHANTIHTNGKNMILITGPNMSGKSTFMKSVGMAFVMAYLGIGVAAAEATLPVMDIIITCIDIKDDIEKGYSYFFSEVKRMRSIAEKIHTGKRVIVIGDELFKGTNVQDALDCTAMVLEGFLQHAHNFYFIATHFTDIAARFQTAPACYPVCFDGTIADNEVHFNYRLQPGISQLRVGSLILQQQQVVALLTASAF